MNHVHVQFENNISIITKDTENIIAEDIFTHILHIYQCIEMITINAVLYMKI